MRKILYPNTLYQTAEIYNINIIYRTIYYNYIYTRIGGELLYHKFKDFNLYYLALQVHFEFIAYLECFFSLSRNK